MSLLLRTIERRGRPGIGVFSELVGERRHGGRDMDSKMETMFLSLLKRWRYPLPILQHPVKLGNVKTAHIDFAYPDRKLAIECDGYGPHSPKEPFEHDRERDRYLTVEKWRTARITCADLTRKQDALRETMRRLLFE